jgi:hypothetical protein
MAQKDGAGPPVKGGGYGERMASMPATGWDRRRREGTREHERTVRGIGMRGRAGCTMIGEQLHHG